MSIQGHEIIVKPTKKNKNIFILDNIPMGFNEVMLEEYIKDYVKDYPVMAPN